MTKTKLHAILETGVQAGASDWHIREGSTVALRVDAKLVEIADFMVTKEFFEEVIQEMTEEKDRTAYKETGDADFAHAEDGIGRFRVNWHRQRNMHAMPLRHIKAEVPNLDKLGLPEVIQRIAATERGIILVTGTTGSGKSTTLACMLEYMNCHIPRHIITAEDPIEYNFVDKKCIFEQREVGLDCISFDSALIGALRQDPDVICVGEMRNRHSFDSALTAAQTGHLVMSTAHTSNASQTLERILDFYPAEERKQVRLSLASTMAAIVCQRLMPRAFGKGVVPGLEIMINTPTIRKLIEEDKIGTLAQAIEGGESDGMMSFNQCLLGLVNEGLITEEVALERATNPEALKMNLKGIFLNTSGGILG
jgi:twitching motility protein PilT